MKITGEDLFKIRFAWPSDCYTSSFQSSRRIIKKTQEFEIIDTGRFTTEAW